MDPTTAAILFRELAPLVLSYATQAIEGGKLSPEEAEALWGKSSSGWTDAYALWQAQRKTDSPE